MMIKRETPLEKEMLCLSITFKLLGGMITILSLSLMVKSWPRGVDRMENHSQNSMIFETDCKHSECLN